MSINRGSVGFTVEKEVDRWIHDPPQIDFTQSDIVQVLGGGSYILKSRSFAMSGRIEVFPVGTTQEWRQVVDLSTTLEVQRFSELDVAAAQLTIGPDDFTSKFPHP